MAALGCSPRASCAEGAVWSVAMGCCDRPAPAATGATEAAVVAPAAAAPAPLADAVERALETVAASSTSARAELARAERRHAVGLFTLFLVLLN